MKRWRLSGIIFAVFLLTVSATLALAQEEPPPPYAGLKNPFPWTDAQAQAAGKTLYQQNCAGCHGATGKNLSQFDFSQPEYSKKVEAKPDLYFWMLSEGRLSKGMPPYKGSLSEEKRWQTLTYMWSLGTAPPPATPAPPKPTVEGATLALSAPRQANTGQDLTFTVAVKDPQGKPISGAAVKFFMAVNFFARAQMEIGEAVTDKEGVATIQYTPLRAGEVDVTARIDSIESGVAKLSISGTGEIFYRTEAGMQFPSPGPEVFIGPQSALELGEQGFAPMTALRLPGGIVSWLWLYVGVLLLVWGTYVVAMYQALHISRVREAVIPGTRINTRLIPTIGLVVVVGLGLLMALMVITGPYSHFHLAP